MNFCSALQFVQTEHRSKRGDDNDKKTPAASTLQSVVASAVAHSATSTLQSTAASAVAHSAATSDGSKMKLLQEVSNREIS